MIRGSDVLPGVAVNDAGDVLVNNTEASRDCGHALASGVQPTNLDYVSDFELGGPSLFTDRPSPPSAHHHVADVLGLCPKVQVLRSAAFPIIAMVKNAEAIGDLAVRQLPRDAMGAGIDPDPSNELAIPKIGETRRPLPT